MSQQYNALPSLDGFFKARGVAIVGASSTPGKPGSQILEFALQMDYDGQIYPVHPTEESIRGLKAYKNVMDIPGPVDLVVVAIHAHACVDVSREVARRRSERGDVSAVVVVGGGFSETGTAEGHQIERDMLAILREAGIRLIGPNCQGVIDTYTGVNSTFDVGKYPQGGMTVLTQSGAFAVSFLEWGHPLNQMGLAKFVSGGNMADVNLVDLLQYLETDEQTRMIALYMEGARDARAFFTAAARFSQRKPVVVFKSGRTELGSSAAASHTGSIAGSNEIYDGAFRQSGIIRTYSVPEFYDTARTFARVPLPKGNRICVCTVVGGPGTICVDELSASGVVQMAHFSEELKTQLRSMVAPAANVGKPDGYLDMTGAVNEAMHQEIFKLLLSQEDIDGIVYLTTPPAFLSEEKLAENILAAINSFPLEQRKPVLPVLLFGDAVSKMRRIMEDAGLPTFEFPDMAAKAMANLVRYADYRRRGGAIQQMDDQATQTPAVIASARAAGRNFLLEPEAYQLCQEFGIPHPAWELAESAESAAAAAARIGYPVVLKIVSPDILHKSDAGGVIVGLRDEAEVQAGYARLLENVRTRASGAQITGVLVQAQRKAPVEVVVGGLRDPQFGPVVMFGSGGVLIEVFKDVSFRLAPLDTAEALRQMQETKAYTMLQGVRGNAASDIPGMANLIVAAGNLLSQVPEIQELDFNPVLAGPDGCIVVDARIILKPA